MKPTLFIIIIVLLLTTLGCGITVNNPRVETGATQTLELDETLPSTAGVSEVTIEMAAGTLNIEPSADDKLSGRVDYNVPSWNPTIKRDSGSLTLSQGHDRNIGNITGNDIINDWDLTLGNQVVLDLTINAGAYKGRLDLSGLRLKRLEINDGASDGDVKFNVPNPEVMEKLVYRTGASKVNLYGLANANFTEMSFDSGAGDYLLDFSGTLNMDASVDINSGVSSLTIIIPDGMHALIYNSGAITNVSPVGTWTVSNNRYEAAGDGPTLTINIDMAIGNLKLVHR
ncbi:MAG: hypothetical protein JW704_08575 [Anaerolineaceae bacterium]|nr:hypothetical protein [Anaerolineaceae bacterium]MBN2678491.1 hypothetical protein [Anaerolineaceae bacterium]